MNSTLSMNPEGINTRLLELRLQSDAKSASLLENDNSDVSFESSVDKSTTSSSRTLSVTKINIYELLSSREVRIKLLVTGGCWFIYDVCTYGVLLFSGEILSGMVPSTDDVSGKDSFRRVATLNVIASVCALPASILTVYALKVYSCKNVQSIGFLVIAITFIALIIAMNTLSDSTGVFVFYVFLSCALTGGASMTTFVMPSLLYPIHVRTTLNGISAACGKLGAVVGAYLFGALASATSFSVVMSICVILALIAMCITHFLVEEDATNPFRPSDSTSVDNGDSGVRPPSNGRFSANGKFGEKNLDQRELEL
jgi:hypothetical protein